MDLPTLGISGESENQLYLLVKYEAFGDPPNKYGQGLSAGYPEDHS